MPPFVFISPATRGLSLALVRHYLRTTSLPVFGTYRPQSPSSDSHRSPEAVRDHILQPLNTTDVDPSRLHVLPLELTSEESIAAAALALARALSELSDEPSYLRLAFFLGGMLYPERLPADLQLDQLVETFTLNTVSHLLLIKHFSRFLPPPGPASAASKQSAESSPSDTDSDSGTGILSKWMHMSARVGSISDNRLGGWYSYRASKAALNQVIRTFDLHLQAKRIPAICVGLHPGTVKTDFSKAFWKGEGPAICVGLHPGTVKTDFSKAFWKGVPPGKLFEPEFAAGKLAEVVQRLKTAQRGRVWDWKGDEVKP